MKQQASAVTIGRTIIIRKDATVSEVLEETYHFMQNLKGLNDDKSINVRTILNEIDAKKYLISMERKYKIPTEESELTRKQLESYENEREQMIKSGEWPNEGY